MTNEAKANPILYSDWLALLGFLGETEAIQHIQSQGVPPVSKSEDWLQEIRKARRSVSRISGRSKLQPRVKELGAEYESRFSQLKADPTFQEHTLGMESTTFALVELSMLHCFQLNLNTEYVESLTEKAPRPEDLASTVKFCLPTRDEVGKTLIISGFNPGTSTITAVTQNLDMRIAGNFQGDDPVTHRAMAGFVYGFGLPQMSVVEYKGFFILKNGYHRAYALFKKSHQYLPCILHTTEAYQSTGGQTPGFLPIDLVISDKSPILSDFSSDAAVLVPRRRLRVMVSVHAEVQVVPM